MTLAGGVLAAFGFFGVQAAAGSTVGPLCDHGGSGQCARIQNNDNSFNVPINNGSLCTGSCTAEDLHITDQGGNVFTFNWSTGGHCIGVSMVSKLKVLNKDCSGPDPNAYGTRWSSIGTNEWKNNRVSNDLGGPVCLTGGANGTQLEVTTCVNSAVQNYLHP
jgi:hypothetical protein